MSLRAQQSREIRTYMQAKQPLLKGLIAAEDVAAAVVFLLSDAARCITGEIIAIDGGWHVRTEDERLSSLYRACGFLPESACKLRTTSSARGCPRTSSAHLRFRTPSQ